MILNFDISDEDNLSSNASQVFVVQDVPHDSQLVACAVGVFRRLWCLG